MRALFTAAVGVLFQVPGDRVGLRVRGHRGAGARRSRRRAEDDGWLLSITTTRDGRASELLVLDATAVAGPPVARVVLPRGVPSGFHGSWIPDAGARQW